MSAGAHNHELIRIARGLLPEALEPVIARGGLLRECDAGSILISPCNWRDVILYIVSGRASVALLDTDDQKISVDSLGPGDIFGEVSYFTGSPWPADSQLIADEPCTMVEIPPDEFDRLLREQPDFAVPLVRRLVRRIIQLNRSVFYTQLKRRALQAMISREEHVFPDYFMGEYVRKRVTGRAEELAQSDGPVLISGESGVGKEGMAHYVFRRSHHGKAVFLQADLLRNRSEDSVEPLSEEELTEQQLGLFFGSEEPTRDGGRKVTPGYFELSEDGTMLVRGIDQLTRLTQLKLLEAIVTSAFQRVGGVYRKKAKVHLIATTRLDPHHVNPGQHPLLHALASRSISIPPLRTRRREIPLLVKHYLDRYGKECRRELAKLPNATVRTLVNYTWPGNDQELAATLKRAVLVSPDGVLRPQDIYFDLKRFEGRSKINLLRFSWIRRALASPLYPAVLQSAATPFFFIMLGLLFFGPSDPMKNPAAVMSWALGWPIMIFSGFLAARVWCSVCPIGTVGNLAKKVISFERPFPAVLKNHSDFLIAGAVLFIIWLETATQIRNSPFNLGLLLLVMLISAIIAGAIFERQSWCLYLCGLGGMVGVLAKTSLVELRADRNVCISQCSSNECYLGTATKAGCPFGHAGPRLQSNRVCKLCATCIKNCPHDAINLSLRIPGREVWEIRQPRAGTGFLVLGMISGLLCEMITKMPMYREATAFIPFSPVIRFTVVFVAVLLGINLMHMAATAISARRLENTFAENYARYGEAFLPLTLCAFMAFHLYYFITLGSHLPVMASQNLGLPIFEKLIIVIPPHIIHLVQELLIGLGCVGTMVVIYRLGRATLEKRLRVLVAVFPHMAVAIVMSVVLVRAMGSFFWGQ